MHVTATGLQARATAPRRSARLHRHVYVALGALMVALASAVQAETIRMGGTGSAMGTMQRLGEAYQKLDPSFRLQIVPNLGSTGGVKALRSGATDLAAISRPLKPDEAAAGLQAVDYGRTPFLLVTAKPGVSGLALRDVAEIYAGRRTQWADGTPVRVVLRPASDADTAQLASFSDDIGAALALAMGREGMVVGMTDQEAVDAVERLPGGLGTASLALLLSERRRATPLALDGVEPTLSNLASGRYPHAKTMTLVVRPDASPATRGFVGFVASAAGRKLLGELGHLPPLPAGRTAQAATSR